MEGSAIFFVCPPLNYLKDTVVGTYIPITILEPSNFQVNKVFERRGDMFSKYFMSNIHLSKYEENNKVFMSTLYM